MKSKQMVITFKVDKALGEAMKDMENRSEFIRSSVLAALEGVCPLCRGTGTLTPDQKRHWDFFARSHAVQRCDRCHALHLVCGKAEEGTAGEGHEAI